MALSKGVLGGNEGPGATPALRLSGSSAAIILGLAPETTFPRETPLELYERLKLGRPDRLAKVKVLARAAMSGLLPRLCEERGLRAGGPDVLAWPGSRPSIEAGAQANDTMPSWLAVKPDGMARTRDDEPVLLVLKEALWHTTDAWAVDGPPRWLYTHVQHELLASGLTRAAVGVRLASGAWVSGEMRAERAFQEELLRVEGAFYDGLVHDVPPQPAGEIDLSVMKRLFRGGDEPAVVLPDEALRLWETLGNLRKAKRQCGERVALVEARLRGMLRNAPSGLLPNGRRLALRVVKVPGGAQGRRLVEVRR